MANENESFDNLDEELDDIDDSSDELDDDNTDWKAEAKKQAGINKRLNTKLKKKAEAKDEDPAPVKKSGDGLDYGQKAFLIANGIKGEDANKLVQEYMETGKSLEDVVENKHFKNDLKDMEEAEAVKKATPSKSKRGTSNTRDSVEYWIAKGELPPADDIQLRRDVVNARMKKATEGSKFTSNSVVM